MHVCVCVCMEGGGFYIFKVIFKKTSSSVFLGFKNMLRSQVFLDPIKHVLQVFWKA